MRKGIFYNSKAAQCSIHMTGKKIYEILSSSSPGWTLTYSEAQQIDLESGYDFAIFNHHFWVCNWMTSDHLQSFRGKTFALVTEITWGNDNPIEKTPRIFDYYLLLDPSMKVIAPLYAFPRPLAPVLVRSLPRFRPMDHPEGPLIGSFGFLQTGKIFEEIVAATQRDFDRATIRFNLPPATYVTEQERHQRLEELKTKCAALMKKPGIQLKITHDYMTEEQLIHWCAENTLNCFFYTRQLPGISSTIDQAISSRRPLLVNHNSTFRHLFSDLPTYPTIGIRQAILQTRPAVVRLANRWNGDSFRAHFAALLEH